MDANTTTFAGITIPSSDPRFLAVVALHVAIAIVCVIVGIGAMLSEKGSQRHRAFGNTYYMSLAAVFVSATVLSAVRWAQNYPLFILGLLSFCAASYGRIAQRRQRRRNATRLHVVAMGTSYTLLLVAFYVDNGHSLPGWRMLPPIAYWLVPLAIGTLIIGITLARHPLVRRTKQDGTGP